MSILLTQTSLASPVVTTKRDLISGITSYLESIPVLKRTWEYTTTDKRVRPRDLFGSGTTLFRRATYWEQGTGFQPSAYGRWYEYSGATSAWYTASTFTPLCGLDWNRLDSKLRKKIQGDTVNLAQSIAEYRQVCGMVSHFAGDILRVFHGLRSGLWVVDFVKAITTPRNKKELALANRWLEYQYGVKPLMSDIYATAAVLNKNVNEGILKYVEVSTLETSQSISKLSGSGERSYECTSTKTSIVRQKASARYRIASSKLMTATSVGITNPALLAWELIPYSFVIDWLIPIGDYLSSLDALWAVSDLKVIRSMRVDNYNWVTGNRGTSKCHQIQKSREAPVSSIPLPRLSFKPSQSAIAVANGMALLRQLRPQVIVPPFRPRSSRVINGRVYLK